jgi:hypothetical protein
MYKQTTPEPIRIIVSQTLCVDSQKSCVTDKQTNKGTYQNHGEPNTIVLAHKKKYAWLRKNRKRLSNILISNGNYLQTVMRQIGHTFCLFEIIQNSSNLFYD